MYNSFGDIKFTRPRPDMILGYPFTQLPILHYIKGGVGRHSIDNLIRVLEAGHTVTISVGDLPTYFKSFNASLPKDSSTFVLEEIASTTSSCFMLCPTLEIDHDDPMNAVMFRKALRKILRREYFRI